MSETISAQLTKQGWARRFTASEPRLSEAVRLYESLGFEVRLEPVESAELPNDGCRECFLVQSQRYWTIYTRPIMRSPAECCAHDEAAPNLGGNPARG